MDGQIKSTSDFIATLERCNIVVTFNLGIKPIDLLAVWRKCPHEMYCNLIKFCALIVHGTSDCKIFSSGIVVCTGNQSLVDTMLTCEGVVKILREKAGLDVTITELEVHNYVAKLSTSFEIDLTRMFQVFKSKAMTATYEPSNFPGLMFRSTHDVECSITFYRFGNMIVTGFKDIELVREFMKTVYVEYLVPNAVLDEMYSVTKKRRSVLGKSKRDHALLLPDESPILHLPRLQWRAEAVKNMKQVVQDIETFRPTQQLAI